MNCPLACPGSRSGGDLLPAGVGGAVGVIVGQPARAMKECESGVGVAVNSHSRLDVVAAVLVSGDLQAQALERDAVVAADRAVVLFAQDVLELLESCGNEGVAFF